MTRLVKFGSHAGGDSRPDGDIDVVVEVGPDAAFALLNLIGVEHIIEGATGLHIQPAMRQAIARRIADRILEVF